MPDGEAWGARLGGEGASTCSLGVLGKGDTRMLGERTYLAGGQRLLRWRDGIAQPEFCARSLVARRDCQSVPRASPLMQPWTSSDVQEYLGNFKVEEAVQDAVNSAIRHRAEDPVSHVADFLEARALEQATAAAGPAAAAGQAEVAGSAVVAGSAAGPAAGPAAAATASEATVPTTAP